MRSMICLGVVAAALAALLSAAPASAEVPPEVWGRLRGQEVILEREGGAPVGGVLVDAHGNQITLLLPDGRSVMVPMTSVKNARPRAPGEPFPVPGAEAPPPDAPAHTGPGWAKQPVPYAQRPLTLPRLTIAPRAQFSYSRVPFSSLFATDNSGIAFGAGIGITENFEFDSLFAPVQLTPEVRYGAPWFRLTYRLTHETVEVGLRATVQVAPQLGPLVIITPSVPVLIHLGKWGRIDTGIEGLVATANGKVAGGLKVPVELAVSPVDFFHFGVGTAVGIADFSDAAQTTFIPLSLQAGFTVYGKHGPYVDFLPSFTWPLLFLPGGGEKVVPELFTVGLSARGYIYL